MKPLGVFSRADIEVVYPDLDPRRLYEWQLKGYIIKLRNSWYCLPDFLREPYSTWIIANTVHAPSHISLESTLSFYGVLPEGVHMNSPVSGKNIIADTAWRIADPEKAAADFFYLRTSYNREDEIRELRFNEASLDGELDREKLRSYTETFATLALEKE